MSQGSGHPPAVPHGCSSTVQELHLVVVVVAVADVIMTNDILKCYSQEIPKSDTTNVHTYWLRYGPGLMRSAIIPMSS